MARSMQEIQGDYSQTCMRLGDALYRIELLSEQIEDAEKESRKLKGTLKSLNQEAKSAAKASEAAVPASEAPSEQQQS